MDIDLIEIGKTFLGPNPREEQREAVNTATRWWNYDVPHITYVENRRALEGDAGNYNWDTDTPWATSQRPWKLMVEHGYATGVEE
jgi:hypothetical protein